MLCQTGEVKTAAGWHRVVTELGKLLPWTHSSQRVPGPVIKPIMESIKVFLQLGAREPNNSRTLIFTHLEGLEL